MWADASNKGKLFLIKLLRRNKSVLLPEQRKTNMRLALLFSDGCDYQQLQNFVATSFRTLQQPAEIDVFLNPVNSCCSCVADV